MLKTFKPLFARYTENTQKYTVKYTDSTLVSNHLLYPQYLTLIFIPLLYTQTRLENLAFICL